MFTLESRVICVCAGTRVVFVQIIGTLGLVQASGIIFILSNSLRTDLAD